MSPAGTAANPFPEATREIIDAGGEALQSCYQCGLCTASCPWNLVRSFLTRKLIRQAQLGLLVELDVEEIWLCAACGACEERCPRGVAIVDIMRAARRLGTSYGIIPESVKAAMAGLKNEGNPWNEPREKRAGWADGRGLPAYTRGTEYLYLPCCASAYAPGARRIALATAEVLRKAGIDFGILGQEESCCGESARKTGAEDLYRDLARSNIRVFQELGAGKLLVSSPHCLHTFRREYPEFGGDFEVLHVTQLFAKLIADGNLRPVGSFPKRVAYHDPCYLGRHNGIFDEPRMILTSIPGLELVELPDSRRDSICCGGGGGRIWMETRKEERLSGLRLEQAIAAGAEVLAVACPYCMLNFDDSLLTSERGDAIRIQDVSEILREVI